MVTKWEYSLDHEVLRLLHTAHQTGNGFYKLSGFIVMPFPQSHSNGRIVPIPDLTYQNIPRFWKRVTRIDPKNLPSKNHYIDPELISDTKKLLISANLPTPDFSSVQLAWAKYENQIIDAIYSLIPSKKNSISSITIWPTTMGTGASFNIYNQKSHDIYIWLREDKGIATIVEAILTSLTRNDVYENLAGIWQESEFLVDWLMAYSPLNEIIRKIDPDWNSTLTIKNTRTKQDGSLTEKSEQFLQKLGIPSADPVNVEHVVFSPREKEIMDLLVNSSPHPVSSDQIGDILFKTKPEEYSLFAISKTIQRLRDKLEQNGISGSFIQTKRGEGYLLVS